MYKFIFDQITSESKNKKVREEAKTEAIQEMGLNTEKQLIIKAISEICEKIKAGDVEQLKKVIEEIKTNLENILLSEEQKLRLYSQAIKDIRSDNLLPFHVAVENQRFEIIKLFIEEYKDLTDCWIRGNQHCKDAITLAFKQGKYRIMKYMLCFWDNDEVYDIFNEILCNVVEKEDCLNELTNLLNFDENYTINDIIPPDDQKNDRYNSFCNAVSKSLTRKNNQEISNFLLQKMQKSFVVDDFEKFIFALLNSYYCLASGSIEGQDEEQQKQVIEMLTFLTSHKVDFCSIYQKYNRHCPSLLFETLRGESYLIAKYLIDFKVAKTIEPTIFMDFIKYFCDEEHSVNEDLISVLKSIKQTDPEIIDKYDDDNVTALYIVATESENSETSSDLVKVLVELGAKPNKMLAADSSVKFDKRALWPLDKFKLLLEKGLDPNDKRFFLENKSLLFLAVEGFNESKNNINDNRKARSEAAGEYFEELIESLLRHQANPKLKNQDDQQQTPLDIDNDQIINTCLTRINIKGAPTDMVVVSDPTRTGVFSSDSNSSSSSNDGSRKRKRKEEKEEEPTGRVTPQPEPGCS